MKKFTSVFVLLLLINFLVPLAYYQIYYKASSKELPPLSQGTDNGESATEQDSNQGDPLNGQSSSKASGENSIPAADRFEMYNLETQELEELDLISFLVGSAACEMPASYEIQAIKAQMIACHSYYLYCKSNGLPSDDLNLSFNEKLMQKYASKEKLKEYWGMTFDENYQKFLRCASEVKNIIATYEGKPALTPYYAVSCGKTQSSENEWGQTIPYLNMALSPLDAVSDSYLKVRTFTVQEMYDRLMANFSGFTLNIETPQDWVGEILYNESGYVSSVQIGKAKISGRDFRKFFELPSSCFMIFLEDGTFSIATKGYGHGVGMSQFGANQLSQEGKSYEDILNHYYSGITLSKI